MLLWARCPACGGAGDAATSRRRDAAPCEACRCDLLRAGPVPVPSGIDVCHSLLAYEGMAQRVVSGLKYRNDRRMLAWLADGMAALLVPPDNCLVTWAPTTAVRRRTRGFDQAELLARAIARRWRLPCRGLLRRPLQPAQTGRSRTERRQGATLLAARRCQRLAQPVVVVDDVLTTGTTLCHAAQVLRATGAPWVGAVTAAYTP